MDQATMDAILDSLLHTTVTKTVHKTSYPAISPTLPSLSQAGRTVLITGGGTGVGFSIATAFIRARASSIIILGRRSSILSSAASKLSTITQESGSRTKIIAQVCDVVNLKDVEELWAGLRERGVTVDVYIANAAKFTEPRPILELGAEEVWSQMEMNVRSPLYFVEKFHAQPGDGQRFIVNITSGVIHTTALPAVAQRPAYVVSKMAGTMLFQMIAANIPVEKLQIVTMHPGLIYQDSWNAMGFGPERFDSDELCANFAVWLCSKEAAFLHGRYAWAVWDVVELASGELREKIERDPEFLRGSIVGANGEPSIYLRADGV